VYIVAGATILRYGGTTMRLGWTEAITTGHRIVDTVDPKGPAAGRLRAGDEIVTDGVDLRLHLLSETVIWRRAPRGDRAVVRARRNSNVFTILLDVPTSRDWQDCAFAAVLLFVSLVWFVVSVGVGGAKPDQPIARIACISGAATALALLEYALRQQLEFLQGYSFVTFLMLRPFSP
jgi:hypothetical protein